MMLIFQFNCVIVLNQCGLGLKIVLSVGNDEEPKIWLLKTLPRGQAEICRKPGSESKTSFWSKSNPEGKYIKGIWTKKEEFK